MAGRTLADQVRAILVKRAFVPGDPSMASGGAMPPGGDPSMAGGGAMPPGGDPSMAGGALAAGGAMPADPMGGVAVDPASAAGGAAPTGMINMTADEFTKFLKQIMAVAQGGGGGQAVQPDIGGKLDTLIAVLQGQQAKPAAPVVAGA